MVDADGTREVGKFLSDKGEKIQGPIMPYYI